MEEHKYKILKELSRDSTLSQRDLSKKVGLSVGRINYIVNSLIKSGYIKARRFKNARNKIGYMYILTPEGFREKVEITNLFLMKKSRE